MSGVFWKIRRKWPIFRENCVFGGFGGLRGGTGGLGGMFFVANFPRSPLVVVLKRYDGRLGREIEIPKFQDFGIFGENGYFLGGGELGCL